MALHDDRLEHGQAVADPEADHVRDSDAAVAPVDRLHEDLVEERRRFATLMTSLPGMAFRIRNAPDWPVEFISEGCLDLIGWRPDEIIGNRVVSHADCIHPEDKQKVWECMQAALGERRPYQIEYRIIDKSGTAKWVWEQGVGVFEDDRLVAAEGFVTDITARVEADAARRDSEARYHDLVANMSAGVNIFTADRDGRGFRWLGRNQAAESLDGYAAEFVVGRDLFEVLPQLRDTSLPAAMGRVARQGGAEHVTVTDQVDGRTVTRQENDVFRLGTGEVVVVTEDVTRRHAAERSHRLKQISIDQANDAMIWAVPDGTVYDCNERASELFGARPEELLGRSLLEMTELYDRESWSERWRRLRRTRSAVEESVLVLRDGSRLSVQISTRHLEFEGEEYQCLVIRDLTGQKAQDHEIRRMNEELERRVEERTQELVDSRGQLLESEKMAALGRLVAGVTHEINTPVGIGVTAASHLQDLVGKASRNYDSGGMTRADFEAFLRDSDQAAGMVLSNLNKASRLIQGFKGVAVDQSDDARRVFDLREYLEETLLSLRPRLKRSPVEVRLECPADLTVDSYPGALSQIVSNLVMNSLIHGFGQGRDGTITIRCEESDGRVLLSHADDGLGMPEDVKDKLYEPFFTTKRGQGGSGLGMHVVYTAVTQMLDGSIHCESTWGEGTTFLIDFPRERRRDDD